MPAATRPTEILMWGVRTPAVPPGTGRLLGVVAVVAVVGVVTLGFAVMGSSSGNVVDQLLLAAVGGPSPLWPRALPVDFLGEPLGVTILTVSLVSVCLVLGRWRLALLAVAAPGAIWGTVTLVKPIVDRTIHGEHLAYPSGHTASTTAFALVIGLLVVSVVRLERTACLVVAFAVTTAGGLVAAWAQTLLVAHYATDTIGGFCLALAVVLPLALLVDLLGDRLTVRLGEAG